MAGTPPTGLHSSANSSSSTLHERQDSLITPALQAELARDQERVAAYGGDDPEEPTPLAAKFVPAPAGTAVVQPKADPNRVQWDGPDDPENPMNWTRGRKWLVTLVVILLSINVYVLRI
jgi:DHA1 family multidrug resistance protein-like MFS transporter